MHKQKGTTFLVIKCFKCYVNITARNECVLNSLLFNMQASDDGPIEPKHVGHILCNKWSFNYYMLYSMFLVIH
jgi:hypothetical protein